MTKKDYLELLEKVYSLIVTSENCRLPKGWESRKEWLKIARKALDLRDSVAKWYALHGAFAFVEQERGKDEACNSNKES